jgi:imidazole glycerol-phosphate synthase subunit HisF
LQMARIRLIARLDIKAPNLIKGVQFEGLRKLGDPNEFAKRYYDAGIDEIIYMDIVASLYQRNSLLDIVSRTCRDIFVPLTVGGGIRSLDDAKAVLRAGADKVAVSTAAIANPSLITDIARRFGSQCMVVSIEAKCRPGGGWEAFTDNGREHTGRDAVVWAKEAESRGCGEILLTSVDRDGTRKGFDVELLREVAGSVAVPVIASGGLGTVGHLVDAVRDGKADAVAVADALHYQRLTVATMRQALRDAGIDTRTP